MDVPKYVRCLTSTSPEAWTVGDIYTVDKNQRNYPTQLTLKGNDGEMSNVICWESGGNAFKPLTKIQYDNLRILLFDKHPELVDPKMGLKTGDSVTAINRSNPKGFSNGRIIEPIVGWYSEYTIESFKEINGLLYAKPKYCDAYLLVSELRKVESTESDKTLELIFKINARITELKSECAVLVRKEFDLHDTGEYDIARNIQDKRINNYSTISALKWVLDQLK